MKAYLPTDERLARYARALGHPARVAILRFLAERDTCFAGDIAGMLPIAASTVSQHLAALRDAGLITGEINPPTIKYCIHPEAWSEARELLRNFFAADLKNQADC